MTLCLYSHKYKKEYIDVAVKEKRNGLLTFSELLSTSKEA